MMTDQTPCVLVVDDEAGIRYFLERFLQREGWQVKTADSGEAALAELAHTEYDIVLLDLRMKDLGGLDVLEVLKQQWPATSVIILTAHASLESAVEALRRGAHDYLFKPCKTLDLRESIRTGLLKRQQQLQLRDLQSRLPIAPTPPEPDKVSPPAPVVDVDLAARARSDRAGDRPDRFVQHGGLIVDSIRHIITLDGALLELSPTEFDLLAYLVSEAPRVVAPQELIHEVQGYASNSHEAAETIRSHMYHIRRKALAAGGRSVVRTVRGVGYTLND
jgi:DNA-binding response OmpR family regulator